MNMGLKMATATVSLLFLQFCCIPRSVESTKSEETNGSDKSSDSNEDISTEQKDQWTLVDNGTGNKEIYGGVHVQDDSFYTSGAITIYKRNGSKLKLLYRDPNQVLREIVEDLDRVIWVVGTDGKTDVGAGLIVKCKLNNCAVVGLSPAMSYSAISRTSDGKMYIAGVQNREGKPWGIVVSTVAGTEVKIEYEKEGYLFNDIWQDDKNRMTAVVGQSLGGEHDHGFIATRGEDGIWKEQSFGIDKYVYVSVWGGASNAIYIAGQIIDQNAWQQGQCPLSAVLKFDGVSVTEVLTSASMRIWSIWGISENDIYIGGDHWFQDDTGALVGGDTRVLRWNQKETVNCNLPTNAKQLGPDGKPMVGGSAVTGFSATVNLDAIYAYTVDGYIYMTKRNDKNIVGNK